jgi:hypothetical protein
MRPEGVTSLQQAGDPRMVLEHVAQPISEQLDLLGPRQCLVNDAVDLGEHSINDQVLQLLLATVMLSSLLRWMVRRAPP